MSSSGVHLHPVVAPQSIGQALIKHLSLIIRISASDREVLLGIKGQITDIERNTDILHFGNRPRHVVVVLRGLLQRYSIDAEGHRQIHAFYLTGEAPSLETLHMEGMDNTLSSVTASRIALVPHTELFALMDRHPDLIALFWRQTLIQAALFREWLIRNSQKTAPGQLAHLFCEMFYRSKVLGLHDGDTCELPLTQIELGDALGMSPVHLNRTLMLLRKTGLAEFRNGQLTITDFDEVAELAGFDPGYLHLQLSE